MEYVTIFDICFANEIIIRMIMEDMNLDFDKSEKFCLETVDYGIVVADSIEVDYDNGLSQRKLPPKEYIFNQTETSTHSVKCR